MKRVAIALFRNDLRLHDNPLLTESTAFLSGTQSADAYLLPLYCVDPRQVDLTTLNGKLQTSFKPATTWNFDLPRCAPFRTKFLVQTVLALHKNLKQHNSDLMIKFGHPEDIVSELVEHLQSKHGIDVQVFLNVEHTFEERRTQNRLRNSCRMKFTQGGLSMVHPDDVPFDKCPTVFTAFRKKCESLQQKMVRPPLSIPSLQPFPEEASSFMADQKQEWLHDITNLELPFDKGSMVAYKGGEDIALERLRHYVSGPNAPLFTYKKTRNALAGIDSSTHFSAFLGNGCLSAREIYRQVKEAEDEHGGNESSYWVIFELLWRDFFKFLFKDTGDSLFHLYGLKANIDKPSKASKPMKGRHQDRKEQYKRAESTQDALPNWNTNKGMYERWAQGQTGIPFIDANMREINTTGYMSNRGRQNVASFLALQLEVDWRWGAELFESLLIDHDVASNTGNWAYAAGVGTDPRSRTFNPLKQAKDYDPEGDYVAQWIPELRNVPKSHRHHPWTLSEEERKTCDGLEAYPKPMIQRPEWNHHISRALNHGSKTKGNPSERIQRNR